MGSKPGVKRRDWISPTSSDQWATIVYFFHGVVDVVEREFCCRPRFRSCSQLTLRWRRFHEDTECEQYELKGSHTIWTAGGIDAKQI